MKKKALIFNILLVVFEVVGLTWSMINKHGLISFKFYTNLSNVLALIAGILFIVRYYFLRIIYSQKYVIMLNLFQLLD